MEEDIDRHFSNPWLTDITKDNCITTDPQEILTSMKPKLISVLEENLIKIDSYYTRHQSDQSVYTGSAGPALLHLHLALTVFACDLERRKKELLSCLKLLEPSLAHLKTHRSTFLCGAPGPLAIASVAYFKLDRKSEGESCIEKLCNIFRKNKSQFKELPSELLYGHAGYLYALLFVNSYIPGSVDLLLIEEVCSVLIECGKAKSHPHSPLMYTWHDKHYLGAAHGLVGILTVLLQVHDQVTAVSSQLDIIKATIDYLLSLKFASHNFPASLESSSRDRLVHWCHGAPGFVHMFAAAYRVFGDEKYLVAAEQCGEVVWKRGLLIKGYSLCHGISGNAYTFLQLYKLTEHSYHLHRALKFCHWCLTGDDRECCQPDTPFSLFEGLTGRTMFFADVYFDVSKCNFPALELPRI